MNGMSRKRRASGRRLPEPIAIHNEPGAMARSSADPFSIHDLSGNCFVSSDSLVFAPGTEFGGSVAKRPAGAAGGRGDPQEQPIEISNRFAVAFGRPGAAAVAAGKDSGTGKSLDTGDDPDREQ